MWDRDLTGTHIMVPLDGSELAERALPVATRTAAALHAELILVRITPPVTVSSPTTADRLIERADWTAVYQHLTDDAQREAREYLDSLARPLREQGQSVRVVTLQGVAAPALVGLLSELGIGLVVMTTHGRTGMARLALGSVADELVRASQVPVLLLRPLLGPCGDQPCDRVLVPLDGSPRAETALETATALAGTFLHAITLLRVVPLRGESATAEAMQDADEYLESASRRLSDHLAGRAAVATCVVGGDPAEQIIRYAEKEYDLVIMATRADTGMRRLALGSVADRVLHETATPLVLIHPAG